MRIVIIGAGMAGLAAGHHLVQTGCDVLVLEAMQRIGGRIHTHRGFAPVPIELGAELIHGASVPTWDIVHAANLATHIIEPISVREANAWQGLAAFSNLGLANALDDLPNIGTVDVSIDDYFTSLGINKQNLPIDVQLAMLDLDFTRQSAQATIEIIADPDRSGGEFRVANGYDQLVHHLRQGLDIRLDSVVTRIEWAGSQTHITLRDHTVYAADRVILTLPLGVLKAQTVQFVPELPIEFQNAIHQLDVVDVVKLFYYFDQPVLPSNTAAIFIPQQIPAYFWSSSRKTSGFHGEIVTGWAAHEAARFLLAQGETQALAQGLTTLRKALQQPHLVARAARWSQWNDNPFIQGVYSMTPTGAAQMHTQLSKTLASKLFWAGEATAEPRWVSTVHGAYASGIRAASELLSTI